MGSRFCSQVKRSCLTSCPLLFRFLRCIYRCWCFLCCWCFCRCYRLYSRSCRYCCDYKKAFYLLDPEGGYLTKRFAEQFELFVSWNFECVPVTSPADCIEDYPIALLLRRQTDRAEEDIASMMAMIHDKDICDRIALINIHVVIDKSNLPGVPTKTKVAKFKDLGIILDFGYERNKDKGQIHSCYFEGEVDSVEAFNNFVNREMSRLIIIERT